MPDKTNERRFHGAPERLQSPERQALLEIDRVVALCLAGIKTGRVLDIGTGTGLFARAFVAKGCTVTGLDINEALLEYARKAVPAAVFKKGKAEELPFGDDTFDITFMNHLLHEADDPVQVLCEAGRVAQTRVAVLEWPYVVEEKGPPLDHRLSLEAVSGMAQEAGLTGLKYIRLAHMDLYLMG